MKRKVMLTSWAWEYTERSAPHGVSDACLTNILGTKSNSRKDEHLKSLQMTHNPEASIFSNRTRSFCTVPEDKVNRAT